MTTKKKGISAVAGLITLLVVLALCVGGSFFFINNIKQTAKQTEEAMPESAITTYLNQIKKENYDGVYENAQIISPSLDSKEAYIQGIKNIYDNVDVTKLVFQQESNDNNVYEYSLFDGNNKVATLDLIKDNNTWLAATIFKGDNNYTIEAPTNVTLLVNGNPLDEAYMVQKDIVASNFSGMNDDSDAPRVNRYEVKNLIAEPTITCSESGYGYVKDALSNTLFVGKLTNNDDAITTFEDAAKTIAMWPSNDGSFGAVSAITNRNTDFYTRIATMDSQWYAGHSSAVFEKVYVEDIIMQSDNTMMANVVFDYTVTANAEAKKEYHGCFQITFMDGQIVGFAINNYHNPNNMHYEEANQ